MEGDSIAGQTLLLLCSVTLPEALSSQPKIAWLSAEGDILISEGVLTVGNQPIIGNPSRLITYALQFSQLLTSHGGIYACQANVSSPFGTIQRSVLMSQTVSVTSKI